MGRVFFGGWDGVLRTLLSGMIAYPLLIVFLRVTGKRTLSKTNAFDLVVTFALGSVLASILLIDDVAVTEGAAALIVLLGLQFVVTWSSSRAPWVRRIVTGDPRMLVYRGELLRSELASARITEDEVLASVRSAGISDLRDVDAVVLETDGSMSVVRSNGRAPDRSSLSDVEGADEKR